MIFREYKGYIIAIDLMNTRDEMRELMNDPEWPSDVYSWDIDFAGDITPGGSTPEAALVDAACALDEYEWSALTKKSIAKGLTTQPILN